MNSDLFRSLLRPFSRSLFRSQCLGAFGVGALFIVLATAGQGRAASPQIKIQDLVAIDEAGISTNELAAAFEMNGGTFPNSITTGTYPSQYTSSNYPSQVTSGNAPNIVTRGNSPSRYVSGGRLQGKTAAEFPMPKINF